MADKKITQLDALASVNSLDLTVVIDDPTGTPLTKKATIKDVIEGATGVLLTEIGYLDGVTSNIQDQLDSVGGGADTAAIHDNEAGEINVISEKAGPASADLIIIEDSADSYNKKKVQIGNLPGGSGGEANTASNVGTAGVGVYKTKSGIELQFKKINAGSSKVTITDDTGNDEVDIDVSEANIDLSNCNNSSSGFITASDVTYENLNANDDIGTGASQVAAGNHDHSGTYLQSTDTITDFISGLIESPANKDYMLLRNAPYDGTITKLTTKSSSGTCSLTGYVNLIALGGTANSVSSTEDIQSHLSSNTFSAGSDIKITVSSNSSCSNMEFTMEFMRALS